MAYLVTGATGNVGSAVVASLVADGQDVRALVRDAASVPEGVSAVVGDLNRPDSFAAHLTGVAGLFLLAGYDHADQLLAAAKDAGVHRVVLLSSGSVGASSIDNAVVGYHRRAEEDVRASGLPWTFLRPHMYMTNALQWVPQLRAGDDVVAPFASYASSVVDPRDVGAVAAAALVDERHAGQAYRLTGPTALDAYERLTILAAALDRPLRLIAQSDEDAHQQMSTQMPVEYVESFFDFYVRNAYDEGAIHNGVQEALGRAPATFETWARDNADRFR